MVAKLWHNQHICKFVERVFKESFDSTKECKGLESNKSHKANKDFSKGDVKKEVESGSTNRSKKKAKLLKHVWVILKLYNFRKIHVGRFLFKIVGNGLGL